MGIEEKAKAYDHALEVLHKYDGASIMFTQDLKEEMFPELKEGEDERIRNSLLEFLDDFWHMGKNANFDKWGKADCADWILYLEKQKEGKEYVFSPLAGVDITTAAEEAIRRTKKGEHLVLAFNGAYIPVMKGNNAKEIVDFYYTYIENQKGQKLAEWSEEEKERIRQNGRLDVCYNPEKYGLCHKIEWSEEDRENFEWFDKFFRAESVIAGGKDIPQDKYLWFKSLRPQSKEEREPMEIKFGGKIYQVHSTRTLPGGVTGYIIEDEPGHYDCITNPEVVSGGGYGVKQNGSPYPAKEATFDEPHWKPSEEDEVMIKVLDSIIRYIVEVIDKRVLEGFGTNYEELFSWLKSLRGRLKPSSNWKPTEEQMRCLLDCVLKENGKQYLDGCDKHRILKSLFNELQKLIDWDDIDVD